MFDVQISTSRPLFEYSISILGVGELQLYKIILSISNDKDLMMATTGRNM